MARVGTRGARPPAPTHRGQARLTHQTSHPLAAHPTAPGRQLGMDPRHPVGASRRLVNGPDGARQPLVTAGASTALTASPRVVPARWGRHPTRHIFDTACMAWFALTSSKISPISCRSPEQTRPRLFLRFLALHEADDSPDEAAAAPRGPNSSAHRHDARHRGPPAAPSCGSSENCTRTRGPAPLPSGPSAPTQPSDADTPAHGE